MAELRGRSYVGWALVGWALYSLGHMRGVDHGAAAVTRGFQQAVARSAPPAGPRERDYYGGDPVIAADQIDPSGRRGWWAARHRESRA
jgi:hypothetical protein